MFGSAKYGATAYTSVGVETGVTAASPHRLIIMLYEGAIVSVSRALTHMKSGNVAEKGKAISKALLIIDSGLRASLNKEAGGEIALNLDALYEYMTNRLLQCNLSNDAAMLEEVHKLLLELKSAWDAIDEKNAPVQEIAAQPVQNVASTYESLAPRTSRLARA